MQAADIYLNLLYCRCFTQSNDLRRHERNVHMRGKLVNYRNPVAPTSRNTSQMNLATYQAFAMQQRALLHHALTYESLMQSAVVTQARYIKLFEKSLCWT